MQASTQIGDVVLVHDARAVMGKPLDEAAGCLRLVGATVEAADGRFLGRVRCPILCGTLLGQCSSLELQVVTAHVLFMHCSRWCW